MLGTVRCSDMPYLAEGLYVAICLLFVASRLGPTASCWLAQIRRKGDNENLAEWVVDITTEADRQGSDIFVTTFQKCGTMHVTCAVPM